MEYQAHGPGRTFLGGHDAGCSVGFVPGNGWLLDCVHAQIPLLARCGDSCRKINGIQRPFQRKEPSHLVLFSLLRLSRVDNCGYAVGRQSPLLSGDTIFAWKTRFRGNRSCHRSTQVLNQHPSPQALLVGGAEIVVTRHDYCTGVEVECESFV